MPLYDYGCTNGHSTESRQGIDVESIPCPVCGAHAARAQVYRDQYMQAETGPTGGKKNEVPPSDMYLGKEVSEFVEASEEVNHAYEKAENERQTKIKRPNHFRRGLKKANKLDPSIRLN